jgi:hypothetical protein
MSDIRTFYCRKIMEVAVEGSVHMIDTLEGDWEIKRFVCADPIHEEFLHNIAQGFAEFVYNQKVQ